jgi:hypothetical protein
MLISGSHVIKSSLDIFKFINTYNAFTIARHITKTTSGQAFIS